MYLNHLPGAFLLSSCHGSVFSARFCAATAAAIVFATTTAATAAVISDTAIAADAELTIDIDQVGSTIAGTGLKVTIHGTR